MPRKLDNGEHTLVRRPPFLQAEAIRHKLQPKQRMGAFKVIKRVGDSDYVLGGTASGKEATGFRQPVHADRLVPLDAFELTTPIEETRALALEGQQARAMRMAVDGRVLVELAARQKEKDFAFRHRKLLVREAEDGRGVWLDLATFTDSWHG